MRAKATLPAITLLLISIILAGMTFAQNSSQGDKQAALDAMDKAQGWIRDMEQLGFTANRANDTLSEAMLLFSKGFYSGAESMANDVEGLKNKAISINSRIDGVEASIYKASSMGINVSQPQELFGSALDAFQQEDYESADNLLGQASASIEELESDYSMKTVSEGVGLEGLIKRIQDNILLVLIASAILVTAAIAGIRTRRRRKIRGRIGKLESRAEKLNSMVKDLQLKYFQKGEISESDYRSLMERYMRRLVVAKRRKLALEGTLKKREKPDKANK